MIARTKNVVLKADLIPVQIVAAIGGLLRKYCLTVFRLLIAKAFTDKSGTLDRSRQILIHLFQFVWNRWKSVKSRISLQHLSLTLHHKSTDVTFQSERLKNNDRALGPFIFLRCFPRIIS